MYKLLVAAIVSTLCAWALPGMAGDDVAHPAYDFVPQVLFVDEHAASAVPSAPVQHHPKDEQHPATYFEPRVIYQNPDFVKNAAN